MASRHDREPAVPPVFDGTWTSVGGCADLIHARWENPLINAYPVGPDDALPPGRNRD